MLDDPKHKTPTAYKLVCLLPDEKVLGVHIVGEGSDEIMQFVGVAVKMGGTSSSPPLLSSSCVEMSAWPWEDREADDTGQRRRRIWTTPSPSVRLFPLDHRLSLFVH